MRLGLGTGSTTTFAIGRAVGERVRDEGLAIRGIPTSCLRGARALVRRPAHLVRRDDPRRPHHRWRRRGRSHLHAGEGRRRGAVAGEDRGGGVRSHDRDCRLSAVVRVGFAPAGWPGSPVRASWSPRSTGWVAPVIRGCVPRSCSSTSAISARTSRMRLVSAGRCRHVSSTGPTLVANKDKELDTARGHLSPANAGGSRRPALHGARASSWSIPTPSIACTSGKTVTAETLSSSPPAVASAATRAACPVSEHVHLLERGASSCRSSPQQHRDRRRRLYRGGVRRHLRRVEGRDVTVACTVRDEGAARLRRRRPRLP